MTNDEYVMTRAGYNKLQRELNNLQDKAEGEMAQKMAAAREDGDLDEDGAFYEILVEKNHLDERILRLRAILAQAEVVDEDPDPDVASPGDRVVVRDLDEKEELPLDLLGGWEIAHGRRGVSIKSPVGKALLGKRVGDKVEVKTPDGIARFKILRFEEIPEEEV
jgi:transcription elongation factor GreA